jgi:hypothetical protein
MNPSMMRRSQRPAPPPMPQRQSAQEANVLPDPPMPDEMAETPTAERAEHGSVTITPEAVCYRMAEETCGNCLHFGADGNCAVLKMQVEAGSGCNAFQQGGAGESPNEAMPEQEMADQ